MQLIQELKQYFTQSSYNDPGFWIYPAGALALVYVLAVLLIKQRNAASPNSRMLHILSNLVLAGVITSAITGGLGLFFWATGRYQAEPLQLSHLLSLALALGVSVWALSSLAGQQTQEDFKNLVEQPKTQFERDRSVKLVRNSYSKLKTFAWLIPLAAALALLPLFYQQKEKLLCFVIDNSFSMEQPLQMGKNALSRTIQQFKEDTHVTLSYFDNREVVTSLGQLLATQSSSGLAGTVISFEADRTSALNQVQAIPIAGKGSPICELIWKTYLFAKDASVERNYDEKYLVLITDCVENVISDEDLTGFLCDSPEFEEFFQSANVRVVQLEDRNFTHPNGQNLDSGGKLLDKAQACGYTILDGSLSSYDESIDTIANEVTNDYVFPIWVVILYVLYALILLALNQRQNL